MGQKTKHPKYGPKATTLWRESCIDHLEICDDPECHVRKAMESWNRIGGMQGYLFENVQSSASKKIE